MGQDTTASEQTDLWLSNWLNERMQPWLQDRTYTLSMLCDNVVGIKERIVSAALQEKLPAWGLGGVQNANVTAAAKANKPGNSQSNNETSDTKELSEKNAKLYKDTFERISELVKVNIGKMRTGQESRSKGLKNIREGTINELKWSVIEMAFNKLLDSAEKKIKEVMDRIFGEEKQKKPEKSAANDKTNAGQAAVKGKDSQEKKGAGALDKAKDSAVSYKDMMENTLKQVDTLVEQHFDKMRTGAETFSQGYKNIFKNMVNEILGMMLKMWYTEQLLPGASDWISHVLGLKKDPFTLSDGTKLDANFGFDLTKADWWKSSISKRETGGSVLKNEPYLVGEQGPELFVPHNLGSIVPHNRLSETLLATGTQAPPVTVNVINKTGVQSSARQETQWDGQQYIVNVVLDAYSRNVSGMRDIMGARRPV